MSKNWAVVVAQLVEQEIPALTICSSNSDVGKILSTKGTIEKTKIKKKRPGMARLKKCQGIYSSLDDWTRMTYRCTVHTAYKVKGRWIRLPHPLLASRWIIKLLNPLPCTLLLHIHEI